MHAHKSETPPNDPWLTEQSTASLKPHSTQRPTSRPTTTSRVALAPTMADLERTVLDFYQISSLNPVQWPSEKDLDSDASDNAEAEAAAKKKKASRRKSRYQALERAVSTRSSIIPGSETSGSGISNLVQKDEADPLGTTDSVVRTLKHLGVPLQDDLRLRESSLGGREQSGRDAGLTPHCGQAIASSSHPPHSRRRCFSPRCTRRPTRSR